MSSFWRKFLVVALSLVCFYGLYTAYERGSASAWYYQADFALNDWAVKGKVGSSEEYFATLSAITKAQTLDSGHPHYAHMRGRILHWGVDSLLIPKEKLVQVKDWYLLATELRPLWPDPWVDLTRLNNYLHGFDDETRKYMLQALKTGPYVGFVTIGVMEVLLLNWQNLSGGDRTLMFEQFAIATKQQQVLSKVLSFAKKINRENLLCLQLSYNPEYKKQQQTHLYKNNCK